MTHPIERASVEQADRDAAANAVRAYRDRKNGDWQQRIHDGKCDDGEMVQAFARHRQQARDAGFAEGVEAYRSGFRDARYFFDPSVAKTESTPEEDDYVRAYAAALSTEANEGRCDG